MSFTLELKVVPHSGTQKWLLDKSGKIKCYLKNPAEAGKANGELVALLANLLKVSQQDVVIIRGLTSRTKVIRVPIEMSIDEFLHIIGLDRQLSF